MCVKNQHARKLAEAMRKQLRKHAKSHVIEKRTLHAFPRCESSCFVQKHDMRGSDAEAKCGSKPFINTQAQEFRRTHPDDFRLRRYLHCNNLEGGSAPQRRIFCVGPPRPRPALPPLPQVICVTGDLRLIKPPLPQRLATDLGPKFIIPRQP